MKTSIGFALALAATLALAHEGHGMSATHWHASDTFGFLLLGAVVAAALWASRRR
jgi:MYXO-CTERM domain-containing protein